MRTSAPLPHDTGPRPLPGRPWLIVGIALLVFAGALIAALALTAPLARAADTECPEGTPAVGDLGITELTGLARFSMSGDERGGYQRLAQFRTEPQITALADGTPGTMIRDGDVIVAVDGALITTREGGRRFANLEPGRAVVFAIRRDGRRMDVRVVPALRCGPLPGWVASPEAPEPPAPPTAVTAPEAPRVITLAPRVYGMKHLADGSPGPEPMSAPGASPEGARALESARALAMMSNRGWFGLGIDCADCHWASLPGDSGVMWVSGEYPTIYRVDSGSPAERAGLQRGDVLTHIDGLSLLTPEGGRRFGAVKPGQKVRLSYRRDGRLANAVATAEARPGVFGSYARSMDEMREQLRRLAETDSHDDAMRRRLSEIETQMQDREQMIARQRTQLGGMQRLRWTGSVADADVEVKGLGNVTVTTDDATGEIVVTTNDASIHIRPSGGATRTPRVPTAPKAAKDKK